MVSKLTYTAYADFQNKLLALNFSSRSEVPPSERTLDMCPDGSMRDIQLQAFAQSQVAGAVIHFDDQHSPIAYLQPR